MSDIYLTEIRRMPAERSFHLSFDDGFEGQVAYDVLRGWCPCATCQGHGVIELRFQPPKKPVQPESIEPVGHYGITVVWSDQHATGIYRFDFLRELVERENELVERET